MFAPISPLGFIVLLRLILGDAGGSDTFADGVRLALA